MMSCASNADRPPAKAQTVACIGDSITYGYLLSSPESESWPALLETMLEDGSEVANLGVSGSTLMDEGDLPYRSTGNIDRAKQLRPDVFIVMLGTNDAYSRAWSEDSYRAQLEGLVDELAASTPDALIVLMAPPCAFRIASEPAIEPTAQAVIGGSIRDIVHEMADRKKAIYVDLFDVTYEHPEWFPDGLHPDTKGHQSIAEHVFDALAPHL